MWYTIAQMQKRVDQPVNVKPKMVGDVIVKKIICSKNCWKFIANKKDDKCSQNKLKTFCTCIYFMQEASVNGNFDVYGGFACHMSVLTIR